MATADTNTFTVRDWFGLVAGISWGLALGHFFASGDMLGPWLVILLGPPVVLLISSSRPFVSWQLPILAAVVSGTLVSRTPDDNLGTAMDGALAWLMCSVLSVPWVLIFKYRARRESERSQAVRPSASYVGVGALVFAACGLTVLGQILSVYSDTSGPGNHWLPLDGFLMATLGAGLAVGSYLLARKLGIASPVRQILEAVLGLSACLVVLALIISSSAKFVALLAPISVPPRIGTWGAIAGLQDLAVMLWLNWSARTESPSTPLTQQP